MLHLIILPWPHVSGVLWHLCLLPCSTFWLCFADVLSSLETTKDKVRNSYQRPSWLIEALVFLSLANAFITLNPLMVAEQIFYLEVTYFSGRLVPWNLIGYFLGVFNWTLVLMAQPFQASGNIPSLEQIWNCYIVWVKFFLSMVVGKTACECTVNVGSRNV